MTLVSVTRGLCCTSTSSACRVEAIVGCYRVCCPVLSGRADRDTADSRRRDLSGSRTRNGNRSTMTGSVFAPMTSERRWPSYRSRDHSGPGCRAGRVSLAMSGLGEMKQCLLNTTYISTSTTYSMFSFRISTLCARDM